MIAGFHWNNLTHHYSDDKQYVVNAKGVPILYPWEDHHLPRDRNDFYHRSDLLLLTSLSCLQTLLQEHTHFNRARSTLGTSSVGDLPLMNGMYCVFFACVEWDFEYYPIPASTGTTTCLGILYFQKKGVYIIQGGKHNVLHGVHPLYKQIKQVYTQS